MAPKTLPPNFPKTLPPHFDDPTKDGLGRPAMPFEQAAWCHCGAVEFKVEGYLRMSGFCHCKSCSRNRGVNPVHCIMVQPRDCLTITKGEDKVRMLTTDLGMGPMDRNFCVECGCMIWQGPREIRGFGKACPWRTFMPTCFRFEQGEKGAKLPKYLLPWAHFNYENRLMDVDDNLPKFDSFPGLGALVDNKGRAKEGPRKFVTFLKLYFRVPSLPRWYSLVMQVAAAVAMTQAARKSMLPQWLSKVAAVLCVSAALSLLDRM